MTVWTMRMRYALLAAMVVASAAGDMLPACCAQSSVRAWGRLQFDTESRSLVAAKVSAGGEATILLRSDGRVFCQGATINGNCDLPPAPPGLVYVDVAIGEFAAVGMLSDGSLVMGGMYPGVPYSRVAAPPPGLSYMKITAGGYVAALRSDNVVETFGMPIAQPPLPPGVVVVDIEAGTGHFVALLSNGSIMAWGGNGAGQCSVPPLPPGTLYLSVDAGRVHTIALRSDGQVVTFGDNTVGTCGPIPALPVGVSWVSVAGGGLSSVGIRSDGRIVVWGGINSSNTTIPPGLTGQVSVGERHLIVTNSSGGVYYIGSNDRFQGYLPSVIAPEHCVEIAASDKHALAVMSDGTMVGWGDNLRGLCDVPVLPPAMQYQSAFAGYWHCAAVRTDGSMVAWGDPLYGRCNVPPLPAGIRYVGASLGRDTSVALRSDGVAVGFGDNAHGELSFPTLPAGLRYEEVDADYQFTVLRRSDGVIQVVGAGGAGLQAVPSLPAGGQYVQVASGYDHVLARRSDGALVAWGNLGSTWGPPPPLPRGVYYVEVAAQPFFAMARRSDGEVVVFGKSPSYATPVPPLDPGTSYLQVVASTGAMARVGPASTYVSFATGCAGSRSTSRLVPLDTPRIGASQVVHAFDLPANAAVMVFGLNQFAPAPLSLAPYGMPGCTWRVAVDATTLIVGQAGVARFELPIPDAPGLVGLSFYNQAIVVDLAANAFGAVVSDAAVAVVGR